MTKKIEKALNLPEYDIRLVEKNMRAGLMDRKDYESHLKGLPDDEANAELIEIADETTEDQNGSDEKSNPERLTFS